MTELTTTSQIESLVIKHFDGALNLEQDRMLADLLKESREAREIFLSYMRLEGRLHSLGRDGLLIEVAETPINSPIRHVRYRNVFAVSAVSACLAGALLFLFAAFELSSVNASSVMQRVKTAATQMVDRTYRVTLFENDASPNTASKAMVNARGGGHFLVRADGDSFVLGSNGDRYWATRGNGPILIAENRGAFRSLVRQAKPQGLFFLGIAASTDEPLLLDIEGLLVLIERHYEIKLMDSDNDSVHWIHGKRRTTAQSNGSHRPDQIDVFVDKDSGVAIQLDLVWHGGSKMQFEFDGSSDLPVQWYEHSYHFPKRSIKYLSEGKNLNKRSTIPFSND